MCEHFKEYKVNILNGSSNFNFLWESADENFYSLTNSESIELKPVNNNSVYYVSIVDPNNTSCIYAKDTFLVFSSDKQRTYYPNLITPPMVIIRMINLY